MVPKVVLDTNVLISALGWAGPERAVYELCLEGYLQLWSSHALLAEFVRVLGYPKFRFPSEHKTQFLEDLLKLTNFVENPINVRVVPEEPDDDRVVGCAVAVAADFIITGDRHLLTLGRYGQTRIVTAAEYIG